MPNRILREGILTSERVNALTDFGEIFYRRLISKVDDFGRFDGRPTLLLAELFGLQLDRRTTEMVDNAAQECAEAGLIVRYVVEDKPYLQVQDFRQQTRAKTSRYPEPPKGGGDRSAKPLKGGEVQKDAPKGARPSPKRDGTPRNSLESEISGQDAQHMRSTCIADDKRLRECAHLDGYGYGDGYGDVPPKPPKGGGAFDAFWAQYPRKVGKTTAKRAWTRGKCDGIAETVMVGLARCKASKQWRKNGGEFIPYPTTWLNRGGWNDELEPDDSVGDVLHPFDDFGGEA